MNLAIRTLTAAGMGALLSGPAFADHLDIVVEGVKQDGATFMFPSVRIDQDGFLVVHAMEGGQPTLPGSVGHIMVEAGTTENVSVTLDPAPEPGAEYMVMLHYDTNANGQYEFGEGMTDVDTPGVKPDGEAWSKAFRTGM